MTLKEAAVDKKNNLNFIRLFASLMVLYMHSFAICIADQSQDIFGILTFKKELAGGIAVDIFFVISGFLIIRSFDRSRSLSRYFKARFLRIWPLLCIVVLLSCFVLGPLVSDYGPKIYFMGDYQGYLLNMFFIGSQSTLPGLFTNHYSHAINGSLWTLTYEVICYFLVVMLFPLWSRYKASGPVFAISMGIIHLIYSTGHGIGLGPVSPDFISNFARLSMFFAVGSTYYLYEDRIKLKWQYFLLALILDLFLTYFFDFSIVFAVFGSYLIFFIAFQKKFVARAYDKVGDLSYSIYLLAFPIQQTLLHFMGHPTETYNTMTMDPYLNMALTVLILIPLSYMSWHLIEKQFLKLK
ncbi:MAG: acyltransferase [Pseudobutyrivibrio sp.]|nr:acyltransferase [Pseudobutyrivibrio sp.]